MSTPPLLPPPPPPLLMVRLPLLPLPVGGGSAGSAATTLCPPRGRQVRAARQALLLPAACIVRRILAWCSAPLSCCRGRGASRSASCQMPVLQPGMLALARQK